MADWFVGKAAHCSDANGGTTWADGKLTITSLLTVAYGNGDRLLAGPGVYREKVTLNGSGGNTYVVGDVDVTNESTAVTGNGTGFGAAGVAAGDQLFIGNFASGNDGVTNGTALFTSAAGNFQTNMIGFMIEIIGKGAYTIVAVAAANSITLGNPNLGVGIAWPTAGNTLDYYVVSGEGPYEIAGGIGAATLTLDKPWSGPTLTALDYIIYRPVYLIADITGVETDGVGGVVRITGSDDDETRLRPIGIEAYTRAYWIVRGFRVDCCDGRNIYIDECTYMTFEDMSVMDYKLYGLEFFDCEETTIRRTVVLGGAPSAGYSIRIWGLGVDNIQTLLENLYITGGAANIYIADDGGVTIKNYTSGFRAYWNIQVNGLPAGTAVFVHDCLLHFSAHDCLEAWAAGIIVEQYNNFWANHPDRTLVGTAANSTAYCYLPSLPLLGDGTRWPMVPFFAASEWEPTRDAAGLYGKNEDMFGVHNEVSQTRRSWGAQHHYPTKRDTSVAYGAFTAAQAEDDAMEQQHYWNVQEDRTYTITVQVYLDAAYTGNNPQMTVSQPGVADVVATSTGAKGSWEQLGGTFTTGSDLDWIGIFLKSRNTSALANRSVRWQDLDVR